MNGRIPRPGRCLERTSDETVRGSSQSERGGQGWTSSQREKEGKGRTAAYTPLHPKVSVSRSALPVPVVAIRTTRKKRGRLYAFGDERRENGGSERSRASFRLDDDDEHNDCPPPTVECCSPFRSLCEVSYKKMVMKVVVVTPSSPPRFLCLPSPTKFPLPSLSPLPLLCRALIKMRP